MKISIAVTLGIVAIIAVAVITSLGNSSDQSNQNKIRVAFFPSISHAVPIVGLENGIFENGIGEQIQIETKLFDSGPQVIESIFARSIDVAYVGPGPTINGFLKSHGKDIRILAGAASGGASFIVQPDSGLESIENFDGKRIASPQISNSQDVSLRYYLASNDLKPIEKGGTVFVLNISNPDIYTLFAKGDIDGAWIPEPWATMLVQELDGVRLFNEEKLWPNEQFASVLLIARTDYLENNPEIIQNWLKSHEETVSWINSNPDQTKSIFESFLKKYMGKSLPTKIIDESFSNLIITSDPIKNSVLTFAERADALGYLGRTGYNLDGIFYETDLNPNAMVKQLNG
jgi:NitT/TauT family transport system substrate-binding protein